MGRVATPSLSASDIVTERAAWRHQIAMIIVDSANGYVDSYQPSLVSASLILSPSSPRAVDSSSRRSSPRPPPDSITTYILGDRSWKMAGRREDGHGRDGEGGAARAAVMAAARQRRRRASACVGVRRRAAAACGVRRRRRSSGLVSRYDNDLRADHLFSVL